MVRLSDPPQAAILHGSGRHRKDAHHAYPSRPQQSESLGERGRCSSDAPPPPGANAALYYFNVRTDVGVLKEDPDGLTLPDLKAALTKPSPWLVKASLQEIGRARIGEIGRSRSWIEPISTY